MSKIFRTFARKFACRNGGRYLSSPTTETQAEKQEIEPIKKVSKTTKMQKTDMLWYEKCFSWLQKNENIHYVMRSAFLMFAIIYVCLELNDKWQPFLNKYIVIPYLNISTGWGIALLCLCTLTAIIWGVYIGIHNTRIRWRRSLPPMAIILFLYIYYRFISNSYIFLPIDWSLKFVDWGVILLLLLSIELLITEIICHKISKRESESNYVYDGAIEQEEQDILDYSQKAKNAAGDLKKFDISEHSWSIGVTGQWGTGKTSYINLILENLPPSEYDIIKFNPRGSKDISTIQEDALNLLSEKLKVYYIGLSSLFTDYINALQLIDSTGWLKKAFSAYCHADIGSKKEKLNEALKNLPKKVVFVIDDFDRLTKEEIIEVLKLLDNNADFSNIIYITAYDKEYVEKQFAENNASQNHCCFVDKFFNVEWNTPLRYYYSIYDYIITHLKDIADTTQYGYDISEINNAGFYQNIVKKHIPTMRDAKRLVNLFQSDYQLVRGEVDVIDFLLITVIKYRYRGEYTALFNCEYLVGGANETLVYDEKKVENSDSKEIIKYLFGHNSSSDRPRRIYQKKSFYNYFTDHICNILNLPELAALFSKDIAIVEKWIKVWSIDKNTFAEVVDYIGYRKNFLNSPESIFRYIDVVLLLNGYANSSISNLYAKQVVLKTELLKDYYEVYPNDFNREKLYAHIVNYFNKKELLQGDISLLRDMYLAEEEQLNKLVVLNREEIQNIITEHFEVYAQQTNNFDEYGMDFLYACIDRIETSTRYIILKKSCCDMARQLIEKSPAYYIEHFVRLLYISSHADSNSITCEPFWKQIFGTPENLHHFISSKELDDFKKIKGVRNFWEIYTANNYNPIEFISQGNVQKIIDNDLVIPMNKLHQLRKCKTELDKIISNSDHDMVIIYKKELEAIKANVDMISLNIQLKSQLATDIENILRRM